MIRIPPQPRAFRMFLVVWVLAWMSASPGHAAQWTLTGWNNLGMHCMDPDYSVFSLLPPFNTIHAQLIDPDGKLVAADRGITVSYEAMADPDGSINTMSAHKTNFWEHVEDLFGVALPPEVGLAQFAMPGATTTPQPMRFDSAASWFVAEGIPITPYDDAGKKNTYPLMRLVARDRSGTMLASTSIVLPVSDEMNCTACHASESSPGAEPIDGWVHDADPERDVRLNILKLHDDREAFRGKFKTAATTVGYDPNGLFPTVTEGGRSILCAACHLSEALPGSGVAGISPLTTAIHRRMAFVLDPVTDKVLDDVGNRGACYRCHPGSTTKCLRGAMGSAVAADGTPTMQCQSCHGTMRDVAATTRTGWLDEPNCQSCHTGTAVNNSGAIRYTSVFDDTGAVRVAADPIFATNADTPAPGLSLFRFSKGHGGLACEACHGSTHAEFPSSHRNDNLQSIALQGHDGVLVECSVCHDRTRLGFGGGPHGMHEVGQSAVEMHPDFVERNGPQACQACHGSDYRGTVLSRVKADRMLATDYGAKHFWPGFQVGCYNCHRGPTNDDANPNHPPRVEDASVRTVAGAPLDIQLVASDVDGQGLVVRIVEQPDHGTVALQGEQARYFPEDGFAGADSFTFAASDGSTDSNLGVVRIEVVAVTPTPVPEGCAGDCDDDGAVSIDELVRAVGLALLDLAPDECPSIDLDGNSRVTVNELVVAVNKALAGCR